MTSSHPPDAAVPPRCADPPVTAILPPSACIPTLHRLACHRASEGSVDESESEGLLTLSRQGFRAIFSFLLAELKRLVYKQLVDASIPRTAEQLGSFPVYSTNQRVPAPSCNAVPFSRTGFLRI